jgi:hypothetical protein
MEGENPTCVLRAEVNASDSSSPNVNFLWKDDGSCGGQGQFNSTTSQAVEWIMPTDCPCFMLTVIASAPNYISGNTTFKFQDLQKTPPSEGCPWNAIPEFPSSPIALLATIAISVLFLSRKNRGMGAGRSLVITIILSKGSKMPMTCISEIMRRYHMKR